MVTYIGAMSMCAVMTAALLFCNYKRFGEKTWRPILFIYLLIILSCGADAGWALSDGRPDRIFFNYLFSTIEFSSFGWISYCWLCYCFNYDFVITMKKRWVKMLAAIPVSLVTLLIVTSPRTGLLLHVDENGLYHRGPLFFLQQVGYLYLIFAAVLSIQNWKRSVFFSQRRHMLMMGLFIVSPVVLGGLQLFFPPGALPTMQFSIFLSLLLQFADEQERRITHDSLTKLVNRYEFERILDEHMTSCRKCERSSLYLLMGDLDNFKMINDSLGHLQGDRILQKTADILRQAGRACGAVISRISGDEFLMLIDDADSDGVVHDFISNVEKSMKKFSLILPIPLSMSIGYIHYDGKMSLLELLARADQRMYERKQVNPNHRERK